MGRLSTLGGIPPAAISYGVEPVGLRVRVAALASAALLRPVPAAARLASVLLAAVASADLERPRPAAACASEEPLLVALLAAFASADLGRADEVGFFADGAGFRAPRVAVSRPGSISGSRPRVFLLGAIRASYIPISSSLPLIP